ncbi:hypothetical protein JHW43_006916 [Diplocarpon mali]|nr:hypothetical protein JHW43_006916 [Diplocarpon mali]
MSAAWTASTAVAPGGPAERHPIEYLSGKRLLVQQGDMTTRLAAVTLRWPSGGPPGATAVEAVQDGHTGQANDEVVCGYLLSPRSSHVRGASSLARLCETIIAAADWCARAAHCWRAKRGEQRLEAGWAARAPAMRPQSTRELLRGQAGPQISASRVRTVSAGSRGSAPELQATDDQTWHRGWGLECELPQLDEAWGPGHASSSNVSARSERMGCKGDRGEEDGTSSA